MCPGCGNKMHMLCYHFLDEKEALVVTGEMKWYPANVACDPKKIEKMRVEEKMFHPEIPTTMMKFGA